MADKNRYLDPSLLSNYTWDQLVAASQNGELEKAGYGDIKYNAKTGKFDTPSWFNDHAVTLNKNASGGITPYAEEASHGWISDHKKELWTAAALAAGGYGLATLGGGAAAGTAAGAGSGLGATSIAALTPEAVFAGGLGASNTAIAGMGGAAGIGAAGGGLAVAGGGGLLGGGTSVTAMTPEAAWSGGLPASNLSVSGITPEAIAGAGGGAGGVSGGLLEGGADPYANETAKLSAQNAAPAGTLNPTNAASVDMASPDYLDYANKGMKAYNAVSGIAGGGQQSGGGMANGTTTNQIDPRMAKYIYGDATNTGILDYAKKMYEANPQGMNAQMVAGLNNQWNTISDPRVKQGFDQIQNTGMGLLSMPIAGNPFTNGMGGKAQAAQTAQAPQFNPSSYQGLLAGGDAKGAGQNPFSLMQAGRQLVPAPTGVPYMGQIGNKVGGI